MAGRTDHDDLDSSNKKSGYYSSEWPNIGMSHITFESAVWPRYRKKCVVKEKSQKVRIRFWSKADDDLKSVYEGELRVRDDKTERIW